MQKLITKLKELAAEASYILQDTTSGYGYTREERDRIKAEGEWRDKVIRKNVEAQIAAFLASDEYKNSRGLKRLRDIWIYKVALDTHGGIYLPDHEIEALARCFLPDILAFFESEEGKAEFAAWKAEQEKKATEAKAVKEAAKTKENEAQIPPEPQAKP